MSQTYSRKVSPYERFLLVLNEITKYNVEVVVEGEGDISPEILTRAVEQASEANPGMRVCLKGWLYFSRWVDSGIAPEVHVIKNNQWNGYGHEGTEFMQRFNPLNGGPVADVFWLPGSPSRIVFRSLHAIADGRGCVHWVREVFRALRGESLHGSPDTFNDYEFCSRFAKKDIGKLEQRPPTISAMPVEIATVDNKSVVYNWQRITLDGNHNHLLGDVACFLANYARQFEPDGHVSFTVPIDWRELRGPIHSTGNMTGYIEVPFDKGDKPRVFLKKLKNAIRKKNDLKIIPLSSLAWWIPIELFANLLRLGLKNLYRTTAAISTSGLVSMGRFDMTQYSAPGFQGQCFFAAPAMAGKLSVLWFSNGEHTEMIFSAPKAYNDQGQLDTLVESYLAHHQAKQKTKV